MANMVKLGNKIKGRNRDGWRTPREQVREQFRALVYMVGGIPAFSLIMFLFIFAGFLLPG